MKSYFLKLVDSSMLRIGRACDLIWLWIGDFAVHIQTQTVILLDNVELTNTNEIFIETGYFDTKSNRPETIFDKKIAYLNSLNRKYTVVNASLDSELNIEIVFDNGLIIRTLPEYDSALDDEKWRIFMRGSNMPHMIAEGNSIIWV